MQAHRNDYVNNANCPESFNGAGNAMVTRTIKRDTFRMFNRDSLLSTGRERLNPSGGIYPDCEDSSDNDCCVALHQVSYDQVSDDTASSGCQERCRLERRTGVENACLPGHDECMDSGTADAHSGSWSTPRFVNVMCICGARFSTAPIDDTGGIAKDGEACTEDTGCHAASICFNGHCKPPGIECDACTREVDCDVGNSRAFGVFTCQFGQCIFDGGRQAPDGHACLNNIDCASNDCHSSLGDTGTNLLKRYCRGQANGYCGNANPATYDQLGFPAVPYDAAHIGYHCWGDRMAGVTAECSQKLAGGGTKECTKCAGNQCLNNRPYGTECTDDCLCESNAICHTGDNICTYSSGSFAGAAGNPCSDDTQCRSEYCTACPGSNAAQKRCYERKAAMAACSNTCECPVGSTCYSGQCTHPDGSSAGSKTDVCTQPSQ